MTSMVYYYRYIEMLCALWKFKLTVVVKACKAAVSSEFYREVEIHIDPESLREQRRSMSHSMRHTLVSLY